MAPENKSFVTVTHYCNRM